MPKTSNSRLEGPAAAAEGQRVRQRAAAATCGCARAPSRSIVRQEPLLASFRRGGGGRWRNGHGAVQRGGPLAVQCTDAAYGPLKLPAWLDVLHVLG